MKPKFLRRVARPVEMTFKDDRIYIMLANGHLYSTPLALYYWLQTAASEERYNLEFRRYGLWWPNLENGIYIEEMLIADTTQEEVATWQTYLKRRFIIWLGDMESQLLRHRFHKVCMAVSFSPLWGDDWRGLPYR